MPKVKKRRAGQPTKRTPEKMKLLCQMISAGVMMSDALKAIDASASNLYDWEEQDSEFSQAVARARKQWAASAAENEALVAMAPPRMIVGEDGSERVDPGWVSHITSRLNYMKWMMGKRDPAQFGDKSTVEHAGRVDSHVATTTLSEEQWLALQKKHQQAMEQAHTPKCSPPD